MNVITNDNLLEKLIFEKLSTENIELIKLNFSIYMAYKDNKTDFIIDFDIVYKWVGFYKKGNAKKLLIKCFELNKDYKIEKIVKHGKHGGQNREIILLTLQCFKKFCLKANTKEAEKFYDYYIQLEDIINTYFEEKYIKNNLILEDQLNIIKEKNKIIEKLKASNRKGYVYVMSTDKSNIYKCGRTINMINRKNTLQTGLVDKINILYLFECTNVALLENITHKILNKFRCLKGEHFNCDLEYIQKIIFIIGTLINTLQLNNKTNIDDLHTIVSNNFHNTIKNHTKEPNNKKLYIIKIDNDKFCFIITNKQIYENILYEYDDNHTIIINKLIKNILYNYKNDDKQIYEYSNIDLIIWLINTISNILNYLI